MSRFAWDTLRYAWCHSVIIHSTAFTVSVPGWMTNCVAMLI